MVVIIGISLSLNLIMLMLYIRFYNKYIYYWRACQNWATNWGQLVEEKRKMEIKVARYNRMEKIVHEGSATC
jgi:hypothetical protein